MRVLLERCAAYRIEEDRLADPEQATKAVLHAVARRVLTSAEEVNTADRRIATGIAAIAPSTPALPGVGRQLLVSAANNFERLGDEAALGTCAGPHHYRLDSGTATVIASPRR